MLCMLCSVYVQSKLRTPETHQTLDVKHQTNTSYMSISTYTYIHTYMYTYIYIRRPTVHTLSRDTNRRVQYSGKV